MILSLVPARGPCGAEERAPRYNTRYWVETTRGTMTMGRPRLGPATGSPPSNKVTSSVGPRSGVYVCQELEVLRDLVRSVALGVGSQRADLG